MTEHIVLLRNAILEEAATKLDSKAALYRAYADRARKAGDISQCNLMTDHAMTTEDDARSIRGLKDVVSQ